eukprot:1885973-Pyramimonas_sp.AAC.1
MAELGDPSGDQVVQPKEEATNPKDGLLNTLQRHRTTTCAPVGGVRSRITPTVLAKLYKGGRSARIETQE